MTGIRIGFDISQTGERKAGCGYFAASLGRSLIAGDRANEYLLYPYFGTSIWDDGAAAAFGTDNHGNARTIVIGNTPHECQSFWKNLPADGERRLGNPDIVHANNYYCPTALQKAKLVYTLYDMSFVIHPEFTTEANRSICFDGVFAASCHADFIVAISDYSRKTFLEVFPHYPPDRVRVIPLGSRFSSEQRQDKCGALKELKPDAFWLSVGTLEPRKNLRRLLKAYAMLVHKEPSTRQLVLAGGRGWLEDGLNEFIQNLGMGERVKILGYVTDADLCWLYKNCFAFIYPSIYEGFGLPVLEALSLGAAVITSNTTSLPEVAGDAACYVNPSSVEDIVAAMVKLGSNSGYRFQLRSIAGFQAAKFSWRRCAAEVLEIYQKVMESPKLNSATQRSE